MEPVLAQLPNRVGAAGGEGSGAKDELIMVLGLVGATDLSEKVVGVEHIEGALHVETRGRGGVGGRRAAVSTGRGTAEAANTVGVSEPAGTAHTATASAENATTADRRSGLFASGHLRYAISDVQLNGARLVRAAEGAQRELKDVHVPREAGREEDIVLGNDFVVALNMRIGHIFVLCVC